MKESPKVWRHWVKLPAVSYLAVTLEQLQLAELEIILEEYIFFSKTATLNKSEGNKKKQKKAYRETHLTFVSL